MTEQFESVRFGAVDVESFRVDRERRVIEGALLPWGRIGNNGRKWKFRRGSVQIPADVSRIKANREHTSNFVAYATSIRDTESGLWGSFKVARGEEGDRVLSLAEDKVLDGFSVEVDLSGEDSWDFDPADRTVRVVRSAQLRGVAITAIPAFDDARVTRVAASRKGGTMPEENEQNGGGAAPVDLTEQFSALLEQQREGFSGLATAIENLANSGHERERVSATAGARVTREEPVYRFNSTGPSMVRDAWNAKQDGDHEALSRLRKWHEQTRELSQLYARNAGSQQFAAATTTSAPEVIPPGYRADLYVAELVQGRPITSALSRGTITDATPFTVPVFGGAGDPVSDHAEGARPSEGTLAFDPLTISPKAKSGRFTITRELVDSSNPVIDTIAMMALREDYARKTEIDVYNMLDAAATLVDGGDNGTGSASIADGAAVVKALRKILALYPFTRFGFADSLLLGQGPWTAVFDAEDAQQRPLVPAVGGQNAYGVGNAGNGRITLDGVAADPAWAMGTTAADGVTAGTGDVQALTVKRSDAWVFESGLLTFRFEEKSGPENIELALFGYHGAAVLRPAGVKTVKFTA